MKTFIAPEILKKRLRLTGIAMIVYVAYLPLTNYILDLLYPKDMAHLGYMEYILPISLVVIAGSFFKPKVFNWVFCTLPILILWGFADMLFTEPMLVIISSLWSAVPSAAMLALGIYSGIWAIDYDRMKKQGL